MNYSVTIAGLIGAVALPLLGQWGFSETCSQEIAGLGIPYLLSIPGIAAAWWGRVRVGDVNKLGFRKK